MSVRAGMANLIQELRAAANVGTDEYSVDGVTYWTDDQLQTRLDKTQETHVRLLLQERPVYTGDWEYYEYLIPAGPHFEQSGTDSGWVVRDSLGGTVTGYTVNYAARKITFSADQEGASYYLDCRTYNLNAAAADVWEWKAAHVAAAFDWSSDNHSVKASQEYEHCMAQAAKFRGRAGIKSSKMFRTDEAWGN